MIATSLAGPYLMVCTVLALAGIAKLVSPHPARAAISSLGLRLPLVAVRGLGLVEIALAVISALKGGPIMPTLVGMAYLAFAAIVVVMLTTGNAISCGCFGRSSTPPSWLHVALNVLSAAAAFAATGIDGMSATLGAQAGAGIPLVGLVILGSYLLFLLLTVLPVVMAPPQPPVAAFALTRDRPE